MATYDVAMYVLWGDTASIGNKVPVTGTIEGATLANNSLSGKAACF
tara:strand:+ start:326 stop:463 length:138 start_codon:yes stop_codon:yes gene_type:complete